jgi:hemoglobin
MTSLYEHAGGEQAIHRLEEAFYASVLADPLLQPLFGEGQPHHVEHLNDVHGRVVWRGAAVQR